MNTAVEPGTFAGVRRSWKDGDRIEVEFPMSLRLESVDVQHSNLVSLAHGPLVLFAISDSQPDFERAELLRARAVNNDKGDWLASSKSGKAVTMRPFTSIDREKYSTYVRSSS